MDGLMAKSGLLKRTIDCNRPTCRNTDLAKTAIRCDVSIKLEKFPYNSCRIYAHPSRYYYVSIVFYMASCLKGRKNCRAMRPCIG